MWGRIDGRRVISFGLPGDMRRRLNALVLDQSKTATASLLDHDYTDEQELLERVGEELVVVGEDEQAAAVIAVDSVEILPFAEVGWEFAEAEGEGFTSIDDWRLGHLAYWQRQGLAVNGATPIVCLRFHLVSVEPRAL